MKKLFELEEKLNKLLIILIGFIKNWAQRSCPTKIKLYHQKMQIFFSKLKQKFFFYINKAKNFSPKDNIAVKKITYFKQKMTSFPLQRKANEFAILLKSTPLKNFAIPVINYLKSIFTKLQQRFNKISSQQFGISILFIILFGFGTLALYQSSSNIYKDEFITRSPASAVEYLERPEYRNLKKQTFKVFNIKIPVFVESVSEVKTITIDFSIKTSNRFTKKFLTNYEYKLKDYFFTTVEPVISSFPLKEEGKQVLKEKITIKLNNFLKEQNVEGHIEDVHIIFIVGS